MNFGIPQANQATLGSLVGPGVQVPGMGPEMFNGIGVIPGQGQATPPGIDPAIAGQLGMLLLRQQQQQQAPAPTSGGLGNLALPRAPVNMPAMPAHQPQDMITQQLMRQQMGVQ